jgi:hypothetical protein
MTNIYADNGGNLTIDGFWGDMEYTALEVRKESNTQLVLRSPLIYSKRDSRTPNVWVTDTGKLGHNGASSIRYKDIVFLRDINTLYPSRNNGL